MRWIKPSNSNDRGQAAENAAKGYLQQQGLVHHCSNFHCRFGEIDLVMRDQQEWVFVEVKYRSNTRHGCAVEFFHTAKRKKFTLAVEHFMHQHHLNPASVPHRIDLVAIDDDHVQWFKSV
ncbi:YraN family protein [Aliiglaciecola litoralis]|uniref:UPF0102 protein GCM10009114_14970 n=1 Tax=Aliiglaciecola litoralis TaxID=582857 RepID=A0ABP3WV39_9ALTE